MNINLRLLEKKLSEYDNDNLKMNLFSIVFSNNLRKIILNSISSDENKLKCLKYDNNDIFIMDILLPSLENDESKLKAVSMMSFAELKLSAIKKYFNDDMKLKCMDFFTTVNYKTKLMTSIENDNIKVDNFNYLDDIFFKEKVISSIKSVDALERIIIETDENTKVKILKNIRSDELKLKYINLISEEKYRAEIISLMNSDEEKLKQLITLKDSKLRINVLNSLNSKKLALENVNLIANDREIINYVSKFNFLLAKDFKNVNYLLNVFSSYYNVPFEHLNIFFDRFGYSIFGEISNGNIKSILRFEDSDFKKFLKLFDEENITLNDKVVNNICFKITSKLFDNRCKDTKNIFYEMLDYITNNNKIKFNFRFNAVLNNLDREELNKLLLNNNIDINIIKNLYDYIIAENQDNYYVDILHLILNKYIESERNKYINKNIELAKQKLNTKVRLNKKYVVSKKINNISENQIFKDIEVRKDILTFEELSLIENKKLFIDCLYFKRKQYDKLECDKNIVEKNLKLFDDIIYKLYGYSGFALSKDCYLRDYPNAVYDEEYKKVNNIELLKIIENINLEDFTQSVLSNSEVYSDLIRVLKDYKVLGFGNTFDKLFNSIDVEYNNQICSNIIGNYSEFNKLYSSSKKDLLELLYNAELRGESDLKYKILFRDEDYNFIVKDPQLNSSYMNKEKRLRLAVNKMKLMYTNEYLTVPSFDEIIEVNGKKINAVVGNRTNPINLTLGERTSSCMRIGREAESLFDFCISNPNGFHIVFLDPETNEFISRVSGFRNGNSVFLNQLRSSLSPKYFDKDVAKACEKVCDKIVNVCATSNEKLDYVFITDDFAMKDERKPNASFPVNITSGYPDIYTNLKSGGIILYSENGFPKSRPKLNLYNVKSKYPLVRDKVREYYTIDAKHEAQRLEMISELLSGKEFSKIKIEFKNLIYLISGEDWYIALDNENNLIEYIIDARKDNKRTIDEMNYYKNFILDKSNYIMNDNKVRGM